MPVERIIAIDFGTSTSVVRVKRYQDGQPVGDRLETKPVTFNWGSTMVPTLVQKMKSTGESVYFGHEAKTSHKNTETFRNFKVDLESPDPAVQERARALTAEFFGYLFKTYREQSLGGHLGETDDRERTIISYPVKWGEDTKAFLLETARNAGFPNAEGQDEAQSAIQAVTVQSEKQLCESGYFTFGVPVNILLIDMGAGTTDLVLCRYTPGESAKTEILTTWPKEGGTLFGGQEMDGLLQDYICAAIPENSADIVRKKIGTDDFKTWKETVVSPVLARRESVDYFSALDNLLGLLDIDAEYLVDRPSLEGFMSDYLRQLPELVNGCLREAGISGDSVDLTVLTGGHSQWYFVRDILSGALNRFGTVGLRKIQADPGRIISIALPQETVALGLAYSPLITFHSTEFDRIRAAALRGDAIAQNNLGECYYYGRGVAQDYKLAVQWYRKAADQGHALAQNNLGACYYNGQGVAQDYKLAVQWYRKAVEQDNAWAQYNLGKCYYNGQGVAQDYKLAVQWYRKAADQGHALAQNNLGACYYNGQGVAQDYKLAVQWYRKAVDQDNAWAQNNLGACYYYGRGVAQDYKLAVQWYRKAADQGNANAQNWLGVCYGRGHGVTLDYKQALQWYRKAADQGNATAQYNLGVYYDNGYGVDRDYEQAVQWYRKAADQGDADAKKALRPRVIFKRRGKFLGARRVLMFRIDGGEKQEVKNGETHTVSLSPGTHAIDVANKPILSDYIDWYEKNADHLTEQFDEGDVLVLDLTISEENAYWEYISGEKNNR